MLYDVHDAGHRQNFSYLGTGSEIHNVKWWQPPVPRTSYPLTKKQIGTSRINTVPGGYIRWPDHWFVSVKYHKATYLLVPSLVWFSSLQMLIKSIYLHRHISFNTNTFIMRTILLHSILTGCTSSLTVGDRSNFFTRAFDSFITPFPVEVPQVPTCTLDDQFIDGIRARSCNDFGFKLGNSITDEKKPTLSSSAGDENRFISGPTNHGISAASTFPSPYLLASGDIVNLPQLGGVALSTAFGIFIACAHSLLNLLSSSGDANSGVTRNVEVPASGTKSDDETEILSTEAGGWMDQDQQDSPCPVEIYEHRILALCDIGIQSIGYSELDDMFILRNPTLCELVIDSFNSRFFSSEPLLMSWARRI